MSEEELVRRRASLNSVQRAQLEQRVRGELPTNESTGPIRTNRTTAPLSFAQERLWFLNRLMPNSTLYNEQIILPMRFMHNVHVLERSLNEIIRRHEILRTHFSTTPDETPVQIVESDVQLTLAVVDLRSVPPTLRSDRTRHILRQQASVIFDFSVAPLMRAALLQFADDDALLVVNLHHIVTDGWSVNVFLRELTAIYERFATGRPAILSPLPIQYVDYAIWERERLQGVELARLLDYWTNALRDLPVMKLPTDYLRPRVPSFHGAQHRFTIPNDLVQRLRTLNVQEQTTLNTALLTVFALVLHRYGQQTVFPIGMPVANRGKAEELEVLIGFFVNTLVLRIDLSGQPSFVDLLRRTRKITIDAIEHQALPFEMLVEHLQPERDLSSNPLCQVAFQVFPTGNTWKSPHSNSQPDIELPLESGSAKFDLRMDVYESANQLVGSIEYSTDLFAGATIERMADHYITMLRAALDQPHIPVTRLSMLTEIEQRRLVIDFNASTAPPPAFSTINHWVEQFAREQPDAPAVVYEGTTLSYAALNRTTNRLAHYLQRIGVHRETLVGLHITRSIEMIVGVLAVLKAGGAFIPLDTAYPADRLRFMLTDSAARLLIVQSDQQFDWHDDELTVVALDSLTESLADEPDSDLGEEISASQLAYVIYTSGSSGRPKGVQVEHRGLANVGQEQQHRFRVNTMSRVLQFSAFSFDAAVFEIIMAFYNGGTLYLGTPENLHPGLPLLHFLHEHGISIATLPPSALAALPVRSLPALTTITVAGEPCPATLVETWATGRHFFNLYGPTEATIWATCADCLADGSKPSIGRVIANTQVYVLDPDGNLVPQGIPGELYIGGIGIARGYLNRPDLTATQFIPNPFSDQAEARLYRTGDLVRYLPSGELEFLGRLDQQIKLRGYRIEIGEVESVLAQHPLVQQGVVVVHEANGDKVINAYIVPFPDIQLTQEDVLDYLHQRLPKFMIPAQCMLVDALPLLPNGKIDRKALMTMEATPRTTEFEAPQTGIEQIVAELWIEHLKVNRVGLHDNFFDLGGHSLLLAAVHVRLNEILHTDVPLIALFQYPTVKLLAAYLGSLLNGSQPSVTSVNMPALTSSNRPITPSSKTGSQGPAPQPDHVTSARMRAERQRAELQRAALRRTRPDDKPGYDGN